MTILHSNPKRVNSVEFIRRAQRWTPAQVAKIINALTKRKLA